jgi:hypothetical protein
MSDFQNFVRHAEFGKILQLNDRLKREERMMKEEEEPPRLVRFSTAPSMKPRKKKTRWLTSSSGGNTLLSTTLEDDNHVTTFNAIDPGSSSYDGAAELIRKTLLVPSPNDGLPQAAISVVRRGESLVTDSLIDETINSLISELKLCLDLKEQRRARTSRQTTATMPGSTALLPQQLIAIDVDRGGNGGGGTATTRTNHNASKFSKWQTDILTNWMIDHREHPFPTQDEIRELAKATNLTTTQVINWTTNVRKRNLKGTVESGKKPHHFLDYLFLAADREKKMKMTHPEVDMSPYYVDSSSNHETGNEIKAFQEAMLDSNRAISQPTMHQHQLPNIHRRSNREEQIFRSGNQKSTMDGMPNQGVGRSLSGQEYSSNNYENIIDDTLQFGDDRYMFDYEHDSARVVERPKKVSFERSFESIDDEPLPFLMEEMPAFDETVEWRELF